MQQVRQPVARVQAEPEQGGVQNGSGTDRQFDIVVLGATGFVGRLLVEELACDYPMKSVRWAMAGPDTDRLDWIKLQLARDFNLSAKGIPVLSCDVFNQDSVDRVAASTKVIIDLAGPYRELGTPVMDACVRHGTHMVDLSGEITWTRDMIDKYHVRAQSYGVRLVTACGWEAAASDLGVFLAADYCKHRLNRRLSSVKQVYQVYQGMAQSFLYDGGFGGGTWESLMGMFAKSPAKELIAMQSPYYLCPRAEQTQGRDVPDVFVPGFIPEMREFSAANILMVPNRRIVHRSNALLGYGEDLKYREHTAVTGPFSAMIMTFANFMLFVLLAIPLMHPLLRLLGNRPRHGPSRVTQLKGCWKNITFAYTHEDPGVPQRRVTTIMGDAGRDPGYWSTSRIALEAGLALAHQENDLRREGCKVGVVTPAAGLGHVLVDRLKKAGYTFIVREHHGLEYEHRRSPVSTSK